MSNGASKDYKFGTKNNWRRTIWNDIARRVQDRKNAVVLYLAGAADHDRTVALARGFDSRNLIAIERSMDVAASLRSKGVMVIESDFAAVLSAWPGNKKVDVLFGDFCGGLHDKLSSEIDVTLMREAFQNTVFAFNFLRGRDPFGSESVRIGRSFSKDKEQKHRGRLLANRAVCVLSALVDDRPPTPQTLVELNEYNAFLDDCRAHLRCRFYEYKSGNLTFDSVVFDGFRGDGFGGQLIIKDAGQMKLRRRVSAVLAHRTMRLNKVGPYAERRAA